MGRRGLQFRCKDIALFCYNKIKMELFSLICNIFLYSCLFVRYGVCERHPEGKNTATPCRNIFHAMRLEGCKEFLCWQCVMNGPMARRLRGYDGMTADYISFCRSFLKGLQGFLRKNQGVLLCQKYNTLWNNEIATFLCVLMSHHRNAASLGIAQACLVFCTRSFAFLMMFHHRRNSRSVFLK